MQENNNARMGLRDGIPIAVGYFAMSFAFGIFAVSSGLGPLEAIFVSMFNLTSAGQMAAVPMIVSAAPLLEIGLTQLVINARYALMSTSLSQRFGKNITLKDKFLIAFFNTDEIFAIACGKESYLGKKYLYAMIPLPYIAWILGTTVGAFAGNVLPEIITKALSVSLYAMLVAIIMPGVKVSGMTMICVVCSIAMSSLFYFTPTLKSIPSGVVIIICAVVLSTVFALVAPIKEEDPWEEEVQNG